jgi:hypothetical protein
MKWQWVILGLLVCLLVGVAGADDNLDIPVNMGTAVYTQETALNIASPVYTQETTLLPTMTISPEPTRIAIPVGISVIGGGTANVFEIEDEQSVGDMVSSEIIITSDISILPITKTMQISNTSKIVVSKDGQTIMQIFQNEIVEIYYGYQIDSSQPWRYYYKSDGNTVTRATFLNHANVVEKSNGIDISSIVESEQIPAWDDVQ